ncbi:MAG: endopeptidase La [Oscillospiraceae bacterium]|jgi:ATP-dependent Lon protease|nr:endopeptidase La [Oscillospiraceae bacterium]
MEIIDLNTHSMPVLILRGVSVFPGANLNFELDDPLAVAAMNAAMRSRSHRIFLLAQIMSESGELALYPDKEDLYVVGTVGRIKQVLNSPDSSRALIVCEYRGKLAQITKRKPAYIAQVECFDADEPMSDPGAAESMIAQTYALAERYALLSQGNSPDFAEQIAEIKLPGAIADYMAQNIFMPPENKQDVLDEFDPLARLEKLNAFLLESITFLEVDFQIRMATSQRLEDGQREHILREQMKVIRQSLGENNLDDSEADADMYRDRVYALCLPEETENKLIKECDKLKRQHPSSSDAAVIANYLDVCLSLPWTNTTKERVDVAVTRRILDEDHYGLDKVKERITEFVAVRQISKAGKINGGILCLIGPPGTGKTSIAYAVAKSLNRKMARISLGGVHDEADIRGHRKTYVGAMPGRIIDAVIRAGTSNPLILLDEVDKLGHDYRGDPAAALLEALDPEQNSTFRDHFLEIPFDLSDTIFLTTANDRSAIPVPLLDRMEVIEIPSYTDEEKLVIAKKHLLTKQRVKHGLKATQLRVTDDAIRMIIADYTRESGVRVLERELAALCRKAAVRFADENAPKSVSVKSANLEELLGPKKYKRDDESLKPSVGLVHGLAWTSVGGEVLDVEVNVMDGSGKLELTGNLGDVMKESAKAALSYIRSKAKDFGVDPKFYKTKDIHIHFPEGATPKDGPSAGITVTIALISALTGRAARGDIAMTGEITLRGRVLPIGGLREKTMAALRAGIHTLIIPRDNEPDLAEIDPLVRNALSFIVTDSIGGVLDTALEAA